MLLEEEEQNPNQWTTREVLAFTSLSHAGKYSFFCHYPSLVFSITATKKVSIVAVKPKSGILSLRLKKLGSLSC